LIFLGTFRGVKPSSLISVIVLFLGVKTTGVDVRRNCSPFLYLGNA
jgi:hypothetical protein